MLPFLKVGTTITIIIDGTPTTINHTHLHYRKILPLLGTDADDDIKSLLDVADLLHNGVYYIYARDDTLLMRYYSPADDISYSNILTSMADFTASGPVPTDWQKTFTHVGTYIDIDDILTDYGERFI